MSEREMVQARRACIDRIRDAHVKDAALVYWWIETELFDNNTLRAYDAVMSTSPGALREYEARALRDDGVAYISGRWDGAGRKLNVNHMRPPEVDQDFLDYYGFRMEVGEPVGRCAPLSEAMN